MRYAHCPVRVIANVRRFPVPTVTLDTNVVENEDLAEAAVAAGFEIVHTTITDRELAGSGIAPVAGRKAHVLETIVLGESPIGNVLGSDADATCFETLLQVISDGAFPPIGKRDGLTPGQRKQLRDAMIFCAHSREKRTIFVTNDKRGFIDGGRRDFLQKQFNTKILTGEEFLQLCNSIGNAGPSV